jgi:hypothetical protein
MSTNDAGLRILAIDPMHKGFGYVVIEDSTLLVDWGVAHVRGPKHIGCLSRLSELVEQYEPDLVVIEDPAVDSRRWARVQRLLADIRVWGEKRGVRVRMLSRRRVRKVFAEWNAQIKEEIAAVIATQFPELAFQLPPHRKCYMSEDARMSIFDAASLALTAIAIRERRGAPEIGEDELPMRMAPEYTSSGR